MPAKEDEPPDRRGPRRRLPPPEVVRDSGIRLLQYGLERYPSQRAMREALLKVLRRQDPHYALGGRRLRALLIGAPGLRVTVRYAERPTRRPLNNCPVCSGPIRPIRNRTLLDDEITMGYRCPRCGYWTHLRRRVPIRYVFSRSSGSRRDRD